MSDVAAAIQKVVAGKTSWHRAQFDSWRQTLGNALFNSMITAEPYRIGYFMQIKAMWSEKVPGGNRIAVALTKEHTFRCLINRAWFSGLSVYGQRAAVTHELKHVAHGHYFRMPRVAKLFDPLYWNIASDLAINPGIRGIEDCAPIVMPRQFGWANGMSAEEYHQLLLRRGETMEAQQPGGRQFWKDTTIPVYETHRKGVKIPVAQLAKGVRSEDSLTKELYGTTEPELNQDFDDDETLSEWYALPPSSTSPSQQSGAAMDACGDGMPQDGAGEGDEPDPDAQRDPARQSAIQEATDRLISAIAEAADELTEAGVSPGNMGGELGELIARVRGSWKINWRKLVNGTATVAGSGSTFEPKWRKTRLDKRYKVRPGMVLRPRGWKLVIRDTSGSMGTRMLAEAEAEIRKLARNDQVWVLDGDTRLQSSYRFTGKFPMCRGRGGTSFDWMFEWITADPSRARKFDQVIVFTDGDGYVSEAWKEKLRTPVLWVITPNGGHTATDFSMPFGRCTFVTDVIEEED